MINQTQSKVEFANTLRGLAALSVLISHYLGAFWVAREAVAKLTNANLMTTPTPHIVTLINGTSFFGWGAFGVALFFLISGFVIPFSLSKLTSKEFIINRIFRIYPTYMVGFTLTLIAIFLCGLYYHHHFPYRFKEIFIHYFPGIHDSQRISIDGVIWTLDIEIKFYLVCALASYLFKKGSVIVFFIPVLLGVAALYLNPIVISLYGTNVALYKCGAVFTFVAQYIVFMFIGTVFYYYYRRLIRAESAMFFIGSLFMLFVLINNVSFFGIPNMSWTYGFALILFSFAFAYPRFFASNKIVDFFADISYPLYVVHGVGGYVLIRILLDTSMRPRYALLITTIVAILLATILHKIIELPSQRLAKRLLNKTPLASTDLQEAFATKN